MLQFFKCFLFLQGKSVKNYQILGHFFTRTVSMPIKIPRYSVTFQNNSTQDAHLVMPHNANEKSTK